VVADLVAVAAAAPLALLGCYRVALLLARASTRGADPRSPPLAEPPPHVTVQLPVRDEPRVVARLIDACAALDWPPERLELQLLDDSDDDTPARAAPALARVRARGIAVTHLRREVREGFKAGALAEGLARARGDVLLVLDADFVPAPDLLRRLVPWLAPGDGTEPADMVQARWGHHREDGPLRAAQAIALDAHFLIERVARARDTGWFAFNGTAGAWRREAITDAGGWQGDTLTEDMDLSYRALITGAETGRPARFVYLGGVVVPGELPDTVGALIAQQRRWAKGTVEVLRKLGPRALRAPAPLRARAGMIAHLLAPLGWPAGLLAQLAAPLVALLALGGDPPGGPPWMWGLLFATTFGTQVAWLVAAGVARAVSDRSGTVLAALVGSWRGLVRVPLVAALGAGLAWEVSLAVIEGLRGRRTPFVRTPKRGGDVAPAPGRVAPPRLPETLLACWGAVGAGALIADGHTGWSLLAVPAIAGNAWVALTDRSRG
jgi:hypothetical protein